MPNQFFVKFGVHETARLPEGRYTNELLFFGVDVRGAPVCLRVRDFPATCRFALPPSATAAEVAAFAAWLSSGAFATWVVHRLGDKGARLKPEDVVVGVEPETVLPADRPSRAAWPAWRVAFCCVAAAALFAYDDPFDACPTRPAGPRPRVFSCSRKGSVVLQEFYRTRGVAPFTWWTARSPVPIRETWAKKAHAGTAEFHCADVAPAIDAPPRPGTSVLVFDIEAVKDYLEPGEPGFGAEREAARRRARVAVDAADPKNKGILNSWHDHRVCNVHALLWRDWGTKAREPDESVALVLKAWDGGEYPGFERGEVGDVDRADLFERRTEVRHFAREGDLIAAFYALVRDFDCDVVTGWNVNGYDLWMLERRAEMAGVFAGACRFSRVRRHECRCRELNFQTGGKVRPIAVSPLARLR